MNNKDKSFIGYAILNSFHRIYCFNSTIDGLLTSFSYRSGRLNVVTKDDLVDNCMNKYKLVEIYAVESQGTKMVTMCTNCGTADNPGEKCDCGREIKSDLNA